jgi:hypothetical protein
MHLRLYGARVRKKKSVKITISCGRIFIFVISGIRGFRIFILFSSVINFFNDYKKRNLLVFVNFVNCIIVYCKL